MLQLQLHVPDHHTSSPLKTVAVLGDGDPWPDNAGEVESPVLENGDPWKDVVEDLQLLVAIPLEGRRLPEQNLMAAA